MRQYVIRSLAVAALIGAGGVAYAQADPAPQRAPLTRAEVEQRSAEAFARMDLNQDGKLDSADRESRRVTAFERLDADRSGGISFEEFSAQRGQRMEQRAERGGMARPGMARPGMAMRGADADNDGAVTQAEFAGAALARFDRADANKDGTIGADERRAPRRMMRGERRQRDAG